MVIHMYTLWMLSFFFLSHWELPIDEDSMCDEVSHPMEIMAGKKSAL